MYIPMTYLYVPTIKMSWAHGFGASEEVERLAAVTAIEIRRLSAVARGASDRVLPYE